MIFVDTNVLMYASGADDSSLRKTGIARAILSTTGGIALSLQVLQEFYVSATRVTRKSNLSHADACALVESWTRFQIITPDINTMRKALEIRCRHKFAYWDSAIMAAAIGGGCDTVLSEDWSHEQRVEGLLLRNPFKT